jgi:N-dimethylarginine dimethylaminohydrolase
MVGKEHTVNQLKALDQWNKLYEEIQKDADIELLAPIEGLPDLVFTANAGLVIKDLDFVWLSAFVNKERQGEEEHFFKWFMEDGYQVLRDYQETDRDSTRYGFEGAGDCLRDASGTFWIGHGQRSTKAATARIASYLDQYKWNVVTLVDPRFYHLDTCFCPLASGHVLWYPDAFDAASQQLIRQSCRVIDVREKDAIQFACNAVEPKVGHLIMPHVSKGLARDLKRAGYTTVQLELTEFIKSGGAAKCLTLEV